MLKRIKTKGLFRCFSIFCKTHPNSTTFDSGYFRPFNQGMFFIVSFDPMIPALVSALFSCCGPSTIFWAIWAIIIYTIHGMFFRRSWSHISIKKSKILPPLANYNTPTTIILKRCVPWIPATTSHVTPNIPFRRIRHSMFQITKCSMIHFFHTFTRKLTHETPTTSGGTATKGRQKNFSLLSTVTNAFPLCGMIFLCFLTWEPFHSNKTPIFFTGYVDFLAIHNWVNI